MLGRLFRTDPQRAVADSLYVQIVEQSRQPAFYTKGCVADSVDGRFDLIVLNVFLVIRRLKQDGQTSERLCQYLFDVMFENMDASLREMGVGDLSVSKKIKAMAEAFYGRVSAYEDGLKTGDDSVLSQKLQRNLYRDAVVPSDVLGLMARYVRRQETSLAQQPSHELNAGHVRFVILGELT